MKYEVVVTDQAKREAQASHDWWAANRSADQAGRWYNEFIRVAQSLEFMPERWAIAAENESFPYTLRQLNFGIGRRATHRILFAIRQKDVVVLRVRHLAQQPID
jgi:hypothetical protein